LAAIRLADVTKTFGHGGAAVTALDGITLDVRAGELLCLVGASGCGKSTLLNIIAGLDPATSGRVEVRGRAALMFQEAALFPWLSVRSNVEQALKLGGVRGRGVRRERAEALLQTVRLDGVGAMRPHELSGGMRQRVALARAFAQDADILLMDEPFGALDAMTRDILHSELEGLWSDKNLTVVFVTHNVREAVRLADRVVLLTSRPGRIASTIPITIERPRRIDSPEVSEQSAVITDQLRAEVRRHADD
jgi:NitT/TauT family transport system ATP-binding protein